MTNLEEVDPEDEPRAYRSKGYRAAGRSSPAPGPAVHFVDRVRADVRDARSSPATCRTSARSRSSTRRRSARKAAGLAAGRHGRRRSTARRSRTGTRSPGVIAEAQGRRRGARSSSTATASSVADERRRSTQQRRRRPEARSSPASRPTVVVPQPGVRRVARDGAGRRRRPSGTRRSTRSARSSRRRASSQVLPRARRRPTRARPSQRAAVPVAGRLRARSRRTRSTAGWVAVVGLLIVDQRVPRPRSTCAAAAVRRRAHRDRDLREDRVDGRKRPKVRVDVGQAHADHGRRAGGARCSSSCRALFLDITHPIANPF